MLRLDERRWQKFDLQDVFPFIQRGKRLKTADHMLGRIPYISSSAVNNGVDGFIGNKRNIRKYKNCLTLANSGSVGKSFYHCYEFIASDHVTALQSPHLNKYSYLFIATLLDRLKEKYSFNREINDYRINKEKILLPVNDTGIPDYSFMEQYIKEREQAILQKYIAYIGNITQGNENITPLSEKIWKNFYIRDIFDIHPGKRLTKSHMQSGTKPFIGASDSSNGVTSFISNTNISEDNNVLGVNYNGSVVETFYHPYTCIFSDDVKRFTLKDRPGNQYIYLFLKTIILQQKCKYAYGYKFNEKRMKKQMILLPVTKKGLPDWNYMEQFAKQKFNQLKLQYLQEKQNHEINQ